jgi:hypothetical protein
MAGYFERVAPATHPYNFERAANNQSRASKWPGWASEPFNELFAKDEAEFLDLFTRACAQSDADFGRPSRAQLVSA